MSIIEKAAGRLDRNKVDKPPVHDIDNPLARDFGHHDPVVEAAVAYAPRQRRSQALLLAYGLIWAGIVVAVVVRTAQLG